MIGNSILSVSGLKVVLDGQIILDDISFEVGRDSTVAVIGPNGAGKSVLFRAILNLVPYQGKVIWTPGTKIGYVPQKLLVTKDFPLTVGEFLKFKEKDQKKIDKVLASVDFRNKKTKLGSLSGGEFQRVMIAYALLGDPDVLLFDEPTSGVDLSGEQTIYSFIHKLQHDKSLTIIFISHELEVVYKYADSVLCLNKEKICFGPPKEVVDKESLSKLYGEDINLYQHHDH